MTSWSSPQGTPETIVDWKAVAQSLLTQESCAFHRNVEISTQYAWIYTRLPACLKWAGMAAIASHHVRPADGRTYSMLPCVVPRDALTDPASVVAGPCCPNAQTYGHLAA